MSVPTKSTQTLPLEVWSAAANQVPLLKAPYLFVSCLSIPNPHHLLDPSNTGQHIKVQQIIRKSLTMDKICELANVVRTYQIVCLYCHGGKHRSVAVAEILARHLRDEGERVIVRHMSPKMTEKKK